MSTHNMHDLVITALLDAEARGWFADGLQALDDRDASYLKAREAAENHVEAALIEFRMALNDLMRVNTVIEDALAPAMCTRCKQNPVRSEGYVLCDACIALIPNDLP